MTTNILTQADWRQVRALIDSALDDGILPDLVIGGDSFAGAAERWLLAQVPDAASKTGDDAATVREALRYKTAALLFPTVALLKQVSGMDRSYQREVARPGRESQLHAMAASAVARLTGASTTAYNASTFAALSGRRGAL